MNDELHKVKIKIKKLLAMAARSEGNENEAAIAASMASKLMDKYQLDHADMIKVELKQGDGLVGEVINDLEFAAWPKWLQFLTVAIAQAYDCQVIFITGSTRSGKVLQVQGYKADTAMVRWMLGFLYDELQRLTKHFLNQRKEQGDDTSPVSLRNSFLTGAADRLKERFNQIKIDRESAQAGTGLMVVKANAINQRFGKVKYSQAKARQMDHAAFEAGQARGDAVNLSRPMGTEHKRSLT